MFNAIDLLNSLINPGVAIPAEEERKAAAEAEEAERQRLLQEAEIAALQKRLGLAPAAAPAPASSVAPAPEPSPAPSAPSVATTNVPGFVAAPSAANNFFIPEFPESAWEPGSQPAISADAVDQLDPFSTRRIARTPQEEKAALLQKKWGAKGFTFEVDEKGQMVISNTAQTRAAAGYTQPSDLDQRLSTTLASQIEAIRAETDPMAARTMYESLMASAATEKAKIWNETMQQAAVKLGIPQLEQVLAQNEMQDRQDPRWQEFQSDSPITAKVRQQLNTLRAQQDNEAKNLLAGNTQLAAMEAQLKTVSKVFERHEKLDEQMSLWEKQRKFMADLKEEEEEGRLLEKVNPEMLKRATLVVPSLQGLSAVNIARNLVQGKVDKEVMQAILVDEDKLADLAMTQGNTAAAKVLIAKEAEKTGQDPRAIADQLKAIQRTAIDDKILRQETGRLYKGDKTSEDIFWRDQAAARAGTKEAKKAAASARLQVAISAQTRLAEARFASDLGQWKGYSDPMLVDAVNKAKQVQGKADLQTVLDLYIGEAAGPERRMKVDQFIASMHLAGRAGPSQSYIAPVDTDKLAMQVQALAVEKTLLEQGFQKVSDLIGGAISDPRAYIPNPGIQADLLADRLTEFFGGSSNAQ